jgi:type I restriction enzyme, S subunit
MVRQGYKQTEVGVIPEDWDVKHLKQLINNLEAGVSVNSTDEENNSYRNEPSVLKTSSVFNGKFTPSECKKIAPRDIRRAKLNPQKETIIVSRMNTPTLVGECGYVCKDYNNLFLPDRLWITRFNRESHVSAKWLSYVLSYGRFSKAIKDTATGTSSSMKNIAKDAFLRISIPYPGEEEQRAIAQTLSDVDALIAALDKLIAKQRHLKTATMQQLLTGKKRLPGFGEGKGYKQTEVGVIPEDWGLVELQSIIDETRSIRYGIVQPGNYTPNGRLMIRGQDYSKGWVDPVDMFRVGEAIEERYKNARVKAGDLIITIVGASTGNVAVVPDWLEGANLTQTTARIAIEPIAANSKYCKYVLQSEIGQLQVANYIKGGAQPGLNCGDIEKFIIPLPSSQEEQTLIGDAISEMDAAISALETRRAKTQAIKQGMMQELLTGRTRLA